MTGQVDLSWDASPDAPGGIDSYQIYRTTVNNPTFDFGAGDYTNIAFVGDSTTVYTDSDPPAPADVTYAVTAEADGNESDPTTATVTVPLLAFGRSGASGDATASGTLSLTTTAANGVSAGSAGPTARVTEAVGRSGATGGSVGIVSRPIFVAVGRSGTTGGAGETTQLDASLVGRSGTTAGAGERTQLNASLVGRSGTTAGAGERTQLNASFVGRSGTTAGAGERTQLNASLVGRSGTTGGTRATAERPLWVIERFDGAALAVEPTTALTATPDTLSIEAVVAGPTRARAGELATEATDDFDSEQGFAGAFRTISRSDDSARQVIPADSESPAFDSTLGHLSVVELTESSPSHAELSIEIERASNRDGSTGQTAALDTGSAWSVGLNDGEGPTLSLASGQVGQLTTAGGRAGESVTLPLKLSTQQTGALLDSVGYPEGVVNEFVGDGRDRLVDETGGRQTVALSAPNNAAIEGGTWFATDWELTFGAINADRKWLVELTLSQNR